MMGWERSSNKRIAKKATAHKRELNVSTTKDERRIRV